MGIPSVHVRHDVQVAAMRVPVDMLVPHLGAMLEGILLWASDSKNKFKLKVGVTASSTHAVETDTSPTHTWTCIRSHMALQGCRCQRILTQMSKNTHTDVKEYSHRCQKILTQMSKNSHKRHSGWCTIFRMPALRQCQAEQQISQSAYPHHADHPCRRCD